MVDYHFHPYLDLEKLTLQVGFFGQHSIIRSSTTLNNNTVGFPSDGDGCNYNKRQKLELYDYELWIYMNNNIWAADSDVSQSGKKSLFYWILVEVSLICH